MRAFLEFAVRRRANALFVASGAAALSVCFALIVVVFPPLFFVGVLMYFASAAVVGLVVLRFGIIEGAIVTLGPAAFWSIPLLVSSGSGVPGVLLAVPLISSVAGIFAPVLIMAQVLRVTRSQAAALGSGAFLMGVAALVLHLFDFDPLRWLAAEMLPTLRASMPEVDWASLKTMAPLATEGAASRYALATGIYVANSFVALAAALMVARWWHAILDNPNGFGPEFRNLQFGRRMSVVVVALLMVCWLTHGWTEELGLKILPVVLVLGFFQGLAIAHALAQGRPAGKHWITGLYVLLVIPVFNTLAVVGVVAAGLLDPWLNFRARFRVI